MTACMLQPKFNVVSNFAFSRDVLQLMIYYKKWALTCSHDYFFFLNNLSLEAVIRSIVGPPSTWWNIPIPYQLFIDIGSVGGCVQNGTSCWELDIICRCCCEVEVASFLVFLLCFFGVVIRVLCWDCCCELEVASSLGFLPLSSCEPFVLVPPQQKYKCDL